MPELPDITVYIECLEARILDRPLEKVRLGSPFLLRSVRPPLGDAEGRRVRGVRRLGKRIVLELEGGLFLVLHLMIAGEAPLALQGVKLVRKLGLAAFDFPDGSLLLTEAGTRKRASLHVVEGEAQLAAHDPGGIDVLTSDRDRFAQVMRGASHTLKRSLTDPRRFSGIGNAYSDEILHRAGLSPFKLGPKLNDDEIARLHQATREVMLEWIDRLREQTGDGFPEKVTAFHEAMAVHGKFRKPCPVCGSPVQRIVYASNEANYCAECQTGGKLLADRALSRLLKKDWPRTLEELEELRNR